MSKLNSIFQSIPVKIPDRSGFDLSHEVLTTARTGTVVPITHFEVLPGDTFSMGAMMKVTMPPFATPFMGRVDAELTAAFIPYRLLWQGWQSFITRNNGVNTVSNTAPGSHQVPEFVPLVNLLEVGISDVDGYGTKLAGPASLMNYLGFKRGPDVAGGSFTASALPFLAYHKFCDDWIRDDNNMLPFFPKGNIAPFNSLVGASSTIIPHLIPYYSGLDYDGHLNWLSLKRASDTSDYEQYGKFDYTLALGSLRQRCWAKDYFTTATTRPQAGAESSVLFNTSTDLDSGVGSGSFTIATLRAANSLQKWLERNNIAGTEYGSQILAHFGVTPPDSVLNRSVLLGSVRTPVVVGSVENNSGASQEQSFSPYGSQLGAAAGFGSGFDKGRLVDDFTAKEHGIIMVFFTLIPHAYYNTGLDRAFLHTKVGDFAWPEFANIGDQPIYQIEISNNTGAPMQVFGYNQRYSEYKSKLDAITGLLSDGENLAPYALQRGFTGASLGKEFLEIPTDYLDQVLGVSENIGGFGCMVDAYFDCQALRVLPEYSLPSL